MLAQPREDILAGKMAAPMAEKMAEWMADKKVGLMVYCLAERRVSR